MFVAAEGGGLAFAMHPVPTTAEVLAILDRIIRRIARRLADAVAAEVDEDSPPDVLARVQAEAATTWRSPTDRAASVRGAERLRAWSEGGFGDLDAAKFTTGCVIEQRGS